jgi:hypothetical protein
MIRIPDDDSDSPDSKPSVRRVRDRSAFALARSHSRFQSRGVFRQIFRLSALLILVFVLMKKASNPKHYEPFFGQKPSTQNDQSVSGNSTQKQIERKAIVESEQPLEPPTVVSKQPNPAMTLVDKIPIARRGIWIAKLADSVESARSTGARPSLPPDESGSGLRFRLSEDEIESVFKGPDLVPTQDLVPVSKRIPDLLMALRADAMNRVVDGSVFRSGDADALYDLLRRSPNVSSSLEAAVEIATVPLLQQPDVYRGQMIRVRGQILRVERVSVMPNPFSIDEYWKLWIHPSFGSMRPMVLVARKVPSEIAALAGSLGEESKNLSSGPSIDAQGLYLKRLAYRSGAGADVAPLMVGTLDDMNVERTKAKASLQKTDLPIPLGMLLGITSVIGVVIAVLVMREGSTNEKRIRKLRSQMPIDTGHLNSIVLETPPDEVDENSPWKELKL